jgi:hypothetical protein
MNDKSLARRLHALITTSEGQTREKTEADLLDFIQAERADATTNAVMKLHKIYSKGDKTIKEALEELNQ